MDRRNLLLSLAASPAAMVPFALAAQAQAQELGLITGNTCLVQPETTAGPFYIDPELTRRDITEQRAGAAMQLRLQVVTDACQPIPDARVDVWHCDADGLYSGVRSELGNTRGQTFMRGTQMTDARGIATFDTIYPGWYPGRTPHIHYIVYLNQRTTLTSQLFFPDQVSDQIYGAHPAYSNGLADRRWTQDRIAQNAGAVAIAAVSGTTAQLQADMVVGLKP